MTKILIIIFASTFAMSAKESAQTKQKPNILLIMADDLGFSDLGCYGGEISTPNLDSLAEGGLRFSRFYNTARCWPTRAALLTGFYPQQIRRDSLPNQKVRAGASGKRPKWAVLLPQLLKESGYRSHHIGKWHLDGMPIQNGFDRSYYLKDQGRFFNPKKHWLDDKALPPVKKESGFYATTELADRAIEFLEEHSEKHQEAPFFQYLAFAAPHFPLQALPEDIDLYREKYRDGWGIVRRKRLEKIQKIDLFASNPISKNSAAEADLGPPYHFPKALEILGEGEVSRPLDWEELTPVQKEFQATKMAIHAAMIHRMDLEIGRVFKQIRKMGQWDNTLVIFLSDNGASAEIMVRDEGHKPSAPMGSAESYLCLGPGWSTAANTPFRRHKTWTHEGGISTPLLVSWPDQIKAKNEIRNYPGHVIDLVPTILQSAGASPILQAPNFDGTNLLPIFEADQPTRKSPLWFCHENNQALQSGVWKAVKSKGDEWELYHLDKDRIESNDLAKEKPGILNSLTESWKTMADKFREEAARQDKTPTTKQILINATQFELAGRKAFLMKPKSPPIDERNKPWLFYAPCLENYPDKAESWMHQQLLNAGVAIAGIDVGEAYGSPQAFPSFDGLYQKMVSLGYSKKPVLLGRSRGGLWVSSWAIQHPERVAGIGGIYPVYDFLTYPGAEKASGAYGLETEQLLAKQDQLNPIQKAEVLAKSEIPILIIHGTVDKVVPLNENSGKLEKIYHEQGREELIKLIRVENQGHNFWPGFFRCQELIDFLIERSMQ